MKRQHGEDMPPDNRREKRKCPHSKQIFRDPIAVWEGGGVAPEARLNPRAKKAEREKEKAPGRAENKNEKQTDIENRTKEGKQRTQRRTAKQFKPSVN